MSNPKVSIGMPAYNGEPFIREALNSLLAQTFADFELIISDNASTDGTEAICREYAEKDNRIRYVRQPKNQGALANFRFVLDEAVGEFFMWAAADDVWDKCFVTKCLARLQENRQLGFAMTKYKSISRLHSFFNISYPDVLLCIEIPDAFERTIAFASLPWNSHKDNLVYSLWRKNFLKTVLEDSDNITGYVMDEVALLKSPGAYIPEVLYYKGYRKIVPGHWASPYLYPITRFINLLRRRKSRKSTSYNTVQEFLTNYERVMAKHCQDAELLKKLVRLNEANMETVFWK